MPGLVRKLTAAVVAGGLVAIPTGTIAAAPAPAPQSTIQSAAVAPSSNPWLTLSAMTTSSSSTVAAAAAQGEHGPGFPPVASLGVILATMALAIWILVDEDGDEDLGLPVSP